MSPYGVSGAFEPHPAFLAVALLVSLACTVVWMVAGLWLLAALGQAAWLRLLAASFRYVERGEVDE